MKRLLKSAPIIVAIVLLFQPLSAQKFLKRITDKAKEKVEQKIENKIEEKVDEKVDESLDKVEDSLEKEKEETKSSEESSSKTSEQKMQNRMQGMLKNLGMSGEPVPYENSYNFDYLIQMHIESFDKSGEKTSDGEFITHLNPNSKNMAYEVVSGDMADSGQGMFIMDSENGAMIILSDEKEEKTGIVYGINSFFQSIGAIYEEDVDLSETPETYLANPNVNKTGRTKNIAGYKCEEYIYDDENTRSEIWISKDFTMNSQDYFSTLFKTSLYSHGIGWGYLMEATSVDKNNGQKSNMQVKKVDKDSNVNFSLNDYQITNLGSFTLPDKEQK